jgi:hypothetical protein
MEHLDTYEIAELELEQSKYRTFAQFETIVDSAFHGVYSQAKNQFRKYGFDPKSYIDYIDEYCQDLVNDNVKVELLTQLVYIIH